ncbi:MAG: rhomboid family intramembrane serine protease [Cohaesibacteraceae bacterium]
MEPMRQRDGGDGPGGSNPFGSRPPREPAINVPPFLLAIVVLLAVMHVVVTHGPSWLGQELFVNLAFIPVRLIASEAALANFFIGPSWLSYGTLVTYGLLHGGWMHLAMNALWLVTFGAPVVRRLGPQRFAALLMAGTIAGALTHLIVFWGSPAPLVGISAGVSAIMGGAARFVFDPRAGSMFDAVRHPDLAGQRPLQSLRELWSNPTVLVFCGLLIVSNLVFGAVSIPGVDGGSSIAWQAHVGGVALGCFGFPLIDPQPRAPKRPPLRPVS